MHAVFSNKIQMHPTLCTPISATGDKKPGLFVGDAPLQLRIKCIGGDEVGRREEMRRRDWSLVTRLSV